MTTLNNFIVLYARNIIRMLGVNDSYIVEQRLPQVFGIANCYINRLHQVPDKLFGSLRVNKYDLPLN
jgi:hypothetical protein